MTGGVVSASHGSYVGQGLSFTSASAEIKGWHDSVSDTYITENTVIVKTLKIEEWLEAAKIEVKLTFKFQKSPLDLTVEVTSSPYEDLKILTVPYKITLDNTDPKNAGHNHPITPGRPHHVHKSKSQKDLKLHTSIARDLAYEGSQPPYGRLKFAPHPKCDYGYVDVQAAGGQRRVYFGEWAEEEDWQGVVGLRVEFLDDGGKLKRQIVVADWLGDNGQFYP